MSATEVEMFTTRKKPSRSRAGSSVITDELLDALVDALDNADKGEEILLTGFPRNTKGSAAGFGYQVKTRLQNDRGEELSSVGINGGVHSSARPDPDYDGEDPQPSAEGPWFAAISK